VVRAGHGRVGGEAVMRHGGGCLLPTAWHTVGLVTPACWAICSPVVGPEAAEQGMDATLNVSPAWEASLGLKNTEYGILA
jgi:hypothetical protein